MNTPEWKPKEAKIKAEFADAMSFAIDASLQFANLFFGQRTEYSVVENGRKVWKAAIIPVSKIVIPLVRFNEVFDLLQNSANEVKEVLDFEASAVEEG